MVDVDGSYNSAGPIGWGSFSPIDQSRIPGALVRADWDGRSAVWAVSAEAGSLVQASPQNAVCVRRNCVETAARLCF